LSDLEGNVAVVTGGNGGIGLGLARGLVRAGSAVAIWARDAEKTAAAVKQLESLGGTAVGIHCDISDEDEVDRAMEETLDRLGRVDSCFANAGIPGDAGPFTQMSLEEWRRVLRVNLDGTFLTLRTAARHMVDRGGGGSLVAISSTAAIHGTARKAHYGTSKTAILGLVRALAVELAKDRIRCNAVLPGWTETDLTRPSGSFAGSSYQKFVDNTTYRTPVRRWATADDFEALAVFLADPRHTFHTGDAMVVDGGYTIF
jgi:NAD(P)-dependent dehydrogenase (short-subunit alcohol dehydrogenase family)